MKLVFIFVAGLTLAGCGGHYVAPAEQQAVAHLKSITDPAQLCRVLNDVNKKPDVYGGVATMQRKKRAAYACEGYANTTRFADPAVAYSMCRRGYQAAPDKCKADTAEFSKQAQTLTGAARAEYVEIGNAFRIGCNLK